MLAGLLAAAWPGGAAADDLTAFTRARLAEGDRQVEAAARQYGLALAAEYQLAPKWFLGGNLSIDNARDYRQYKGGIYVRYALESQTGPVPMPVPPFTSPYASE